MEQNILHHSTAVIPVHSDPNSMCAQGHTRALTYTCVHTHVHIHVHSHVYTHACTHTCTHIHTCTHTHMCTHIHSSWGEEEENQRKEGLVIDRTLPTRAESWTKCLQQDGEWWIAPLL
jgi:hypothetical protein